MVQDKNNNRWLNPWKNPDIIKRFQNRLNAPQIYKDYAYNWVACSQCKVCRYKKINEWSLRASKELQKYKQNYFITLTYNEQNVKKILTPDKNGEIKPHTQLVYEDFQKFVKRLRKHLKYYKLLPEGEKLKYILTSEYGKKKGRIHYHIIFINLPLSDIHYWNKAQAVYKSPALSSLWGNGYVDIRNANFETIHYCLKYLAKDSFTPEIQNTLNQKWKNKRRFKKAINWLLKLQSQTICKEILPGKKFAYTLEKYDLPKQTPTKLQKIEAARLQKEVEKIDKWYPKKPIFAQSKGLGLDYFLENMDKILDHGYMSITNGKGKKIKLGIPRYYKKKLNELYPEKYEALMHKLEQQLIMLHTDIKLELNKQKKTYQDIINYSSRQVHKFFNQVIPQEKQGTWKGTYELDNKTIYEKLGWNIYRDIIK